MPPIPREATEDPAGTDGQLKLLRKAVEGLAADGSSQIAYLRELGTLPELDELGLELDDILGVVSSLVRAGVVSEQCAAVIRDIDAALGRMTRAGSEYWHEDAIDRPEWQEVRVLARRAVALLPPAS